MTNFSDHIRKALSEPTICLLLTLNMIIFPTVLSSMWFSYICAIFLDIFNSLASICKVVIYAIPYPVFFVYFISLNPNNNLVGCRYYYYYSYFIVEKTVLVTEFSVI